MIPENGDTSYYVISDLHIGGDEQLEAVPFLDELLDLLSHLETTDEDAELIINGDAFGLWELTHLEGIDKFDYLVETYPELFEQFRRTGEHTRITIVPGNHDHELAAYPEYVDRFADYNVTIVQEPSITRTVADHVVHFEHGHQHDPNNRFDDWGNPYDTPLGYYYNTHVTSRAGQLSERGRFNWLKDVQAVTPTERLPIWLLSKYFYREMHPLLRYALIPFLLMFNIALLVAFVGGLHLLGVVLLPVERIQGFLGGFGLPGTAAWAILVGSMLVAGLLFVIAVPLYLIKRDLGQTIDRFGVFESDLTVDPDRTYEGAARSIFEEHPDTVVYCFGHTHRPTLRHVDGGVMVNTGTWLKRLHRRDGIIGVLPPVFYPSYQLATVHITAEGDGISVGFVPIEKSISDDEALTFTERLLTLGRAPNPDLPDGTVIDPGG